MNKELQDLIYSKYPEIFQNRNKSMQESCMAFGLSVDDGWYPLIDRMCDEIMDPVFRIREDIRNCSEAIEKQKDEWTEQGKKSFWNEDGLAELKGDLETAESLIPIADQVKEKFGALRFYYHDGDTRSETLIRFAESLSIIVCEQCGLMGAKLVNRRNWVKTLCPVHAEQWINES